MEIHTKKKSLGQPYFQTTGSDSKHRFPRSDEEKSALYGGHSGQSWRKQRGQQRQEVSQAALVAVFPVPAPPIYHAPHAHTHTHQQPDPCSMLAKPHTHRKSQMQRESWADRPKVAHRTQPGAAQLQKQPRRPALGKKTRACSAAARKRRTPASTHGRDLGSVHTAAGLTTDGPARYACRSEGSLNKCAEVSASDQHGRQRQQQPRYSHIRSCAPPLSCRRCADAGDIRGGSPIECAPSILCARINLPGGVGSTCQLGLIRRHLLPL